jgi:hypothetical protein
VPITLLGILIGEAFFGGSVVGAATSGIVGEASYDLIRQVYRRIYANLNKPGEQFHELVLLQQQIFLQAQQKIADSCLAILKRQNRDGSDAEEIRWLKRKSAQLKTAVTELKKNNLPPKLFSKNDFEKLLVGSTELSVPDELKGIKLRLIDTLIREEGISNTYKDYLKIDLFPFMAAFFYYQLKQNSTLRTTLHTQLLIAVDLRTTSIATKYEVELNQLVEKFEIGLRAIAESGEFSRQFLQQIDNRLESLQEEIRTDHGYFKKQLGDIKELLAEATSDTDQLNPLEELRSLSLVAAEDAEVVVAESMHDTTIRLSDNLYVPRTIEEKIIAIIDETENISKTLLIVGEAGYGKTSLLWHLYETYKNKSHWEPWLIRAYLLMHAAKVDSSADKSIRQVFKAIELVRSQHRQPLLLIDTVDLLLHSALERDYFISFMKLLRAKGCSIIATCRPQEFYLLPPQSHDYRIDLLKYDEIELDIAVKKHVTRFYSREVSYNTDKEAKNILRAVARGLPIREVCVNPLTLRMLFTIYAPAKIPYEINIFKLYKRYWHNRVRHDNRAGSPLSFQPAVNLSNVAALVALFMLAEGIPELDTDWLEEKLCKANVNKEHFDQLFSRGILHTSEYGTTTFFHQTFFEHSAARGLLFFAGAGSLPILQERLSQKQYDLYISPIYEQALLLAEEGGAALRSAADEGLQKLLASSDLFEINSGLYVYCNRNRASPQIINSTNTCLQRQGSATVIRYLELAPNINSKRWADVFVELDTIWQRNIWRERENIIELLNYLAALRPEEVKQFVERHSVTEAHFETPKPYSSAHKILQLIEAITRQDARWGWEALINFWNKTAGDVRGGKLLEDIIAFIISEADKFGKSAIASRLERESVPIAFDEAKSLSGLTKQFGRLWCIEWQANKMPINDILISLESINNRFLVFSRLLGIGEYLFSLGAKEAETVFTYFTSEADEYYRAWWGSYVLPMLLSGNDNNACIATQHQPAHPAINLMRKKCALILRQLITGGPEEQKAYNKTNILLIGSAIRNAHLSSSDFSNLLPFDLYLQSDLWLSKNGLAVLLIDGFCAGHPGALAAMELLIRDPDKYWEEISGLIWRQCADRAYQHPGLFNNLLGILLTTNDATTFKQVIQRLEVPIPSSLQARCTDLFAFVNHLLSLESLDMRREGALIWLQLLRLELLLPISFESLTELLKRENSKSIQVSLLTILGATAVRADYDVDSALDFLTPYAYSSDLALRSRAYEAIISILDEFSGDLTPYIQDALDVALSPPLDSRRLSLLRTVILRLIPDEVDLAAELFIKLITAANKARLGDNARRKVFSRMRIMTRKLIRYASSEARIKILSMVPGLDRLLGALIVDSSCHEALVELTPELERLLSNDISEDIKRIIFNYKYSYERSSGSVAWPELYSRIGLDT